MAYKVSRAGFGEQGRVFRNPSDVSGYVVEVLKASQFYGMSPQIFIEEVEETGFVETKTGRMYPDKPRIEELPEMEKYHPKNLFRGVPDEV